MPQFGPFYPPLLQEEVNHAERLVDLLRRVPVPHANDAASAWLTGRAEEIECFVGEVTADWNAARIRSIAAALAIGTYIEGLHQNLARSLGVEIPRCCSTVLDVTAPPPSSASVTVPATALPSVRLSREWTSKSKTTFLVSPESILRRG